MVFDDLILKNVSMRLVFSSLNVVFFVYERQLWDILFSEPVSPIPVNLLLLSQWTCFSYSSEPISPIPVNLFRLMNAVVHDGEVSQKTSFIVSLVDEAVNCGQHARYILQFMPPNMVNMVQTW